MSASTQPAKQNPIHVANQKRVGKDAVALRIRLSAALREANKLPLSASFDALIAEDEQLKKKLARVRALAAETTRTLFSVVGAVCQQQDKQAGDAAASPAALGTRRSAAAFPDVRPMKRRRVEDSESSASSLALDSFSADAREHSDACWAATEPWALDLLDVWNERALGSQLSRLKTLHRSLRDQTVSTLAGRKTLLKRARTAPEPVSVLGESDLDAPGVQKEVYDEAAFYRSLLEAIQADKEADLGGTATTAAVLQRRKLQQQSNSSRRSNVDRRASKGRKLRFTVFDKLQHFMAPEPLEEEEEARLDELIKGLFGRADPAARKTDSAVEAARAAQAAKELEADGEEEEDADGSSGESSDGGSEAEELSDDNDE